MRSLKPGWYVLAAVTVYAVVVSLLLFGRGPDGGAEGAATGTSGSESPPSPVARTTSRAPTGMWYPLPGARLPGSDMNLPGAPREYRDGVSEGFDFVDGDIDVPVPYGGAVIAAADGQVIRADTTYVELSSEEWAALLEDVTDGATEEQLDQLRGRQVWLLTEDGRTLRYGHLSRVASGVTNGRSVYRGQVIAYVGNSGTDAGVTGREDGARLRFEVWAEDDTYFGEGLSPEEVRLEAASLFVGP